MAKVKVKKHDTFIDMTAMSDMMVLLLTFFMLTATFMPQEPVQVNTPDSVSDTKVPEFGATTILIDPDGKVFLHFTDEMDKVKILEAMGKDYGMTFTNEQKIAFRNATHAGVPMKHMSAFLNLRAGDQSNEMKKYGVPTDSVDNQFARWIRHSRDINGKEMSLVIKADRGTEYPKVDKILKILVAMKENRYSLITSLTGMPAGF